MTPNDVDVEPDAADDGDSLDDVLDKVERDDCAHVPVQLGQKEHFPFLNEKNEIHLIIFLLLYDGITMERATCSIVENSITWLRFFPFIVLVPF